jgi:tetratricopeptide (TPR) repeat protein
VIERAQLLFQQGRYDLAEQELRRILAGDPDRADAHAFLALSLFEQDKLREAESSAHQAIQLAPDEAFNHYVLGLIAVGSDDMKRARQAADEAIRLQPDSSAFHGLRALIYLQTERWQEALDAATEGLTHDPSHRTCLNHRALALVKLKRHDDAHQTMGQALQEDPEDEYAHANLGWAYLHEGQHQQALEHFSEALRLDPDSEYARQGLVEALKARYLLYRWLLQFFLWMSTLSPRARAGLIIGAYFLVRALHVAAKQYPAMQPFVTPIVSVYAIFVLLTWIIDPMFNLLLQCNKYGRYALSRKQRWSSTLFGILLLGAILSAAGGVVTSFTTFFVLAANLALLVIPATRLLADHDGRISKRTLVVVAGMTLVAACAVAVSLAGYNEPAFAITTINVMTLVVFVWASGILGLQRPGV